MSFTVKFAVTRAALRLPGSRQQFTTLKLIISNDPNVSNLQMQIRPCSNISQSEFHQSSSSTSHSKKQLMPKIVLDFAALSKLRLSSLVAFTTASGYFVAGIPMDPMTISSACLGTVLCASSAGTFNQVLEKSHDSAMKRTSNRPLPSNRISLPTAMSFGLLTGTLGTGILFVGTNPVVAFLGLSNIILYTGPYTISKRFTEWNTWLGSVVGAVPPIMGYAAATGGSLLAPEPIILSSILFLWQFPHFFALSWMHRQDYARGGFQMIACNDPSGYRTANLIQEYSFYLAALPIVASTLGCASYMFAIEGSIINAYLLLLTHKFRNDRSNTNARKIFLCSLWYLPVLLCVYVFHAKSTIDETSGINYDVFGIRAYLKEMCVHEIIVEKNLLKKQDSQKLLLPLGLTTAIDQTVPNAALGIADEVAESPTNTDLPGSLSSRIKDAIIKTPGVNALSVQMCIKVKTEQAVNSASKSVRDVTELASVAPTTSTIEEKERRN